MLSTVGSWRGYTWCALELSGTVSDLKFRGLDIIDSYETPSMWPDVGCLVVIITVLRVGCYFAASFKAHRKQQKLEVALKDEETDSSSSDDSIVTTSSDVSFGSVSIAFKDDIEMQGEAKEDDYRIDSEQPSFCETYRQILPPSSQDSHYKNRETPSNTLSRSETDMNKYVERVFRPQD